MCGTWSPASAWAPSHESVRHMPSSSSSGSGRGMWTEVSSRVGAGTAGGSEPTAATLTAFAVGGRWPASRWLLRGCRRAVGGAAEVLEMGLLWTELTEGLLTGWRTGD